MDKFIISPKEDRTVTMTIRIDKALQKEYNHLSAITDRSRNELICMALKFALDHMELKEGPAVSTATDSKPDPI